MSTPMFEVPEHMRIGVTRFGDGPVSETDPEFHRWGCWCGDPECREWQ